MTPTLGISDLETPPDIPDQPAEEQFPDYGKDFRELPQQLIDLFKSTITDCQGQDKFARRREVRFDRKLRYYEAGYQNIQWWNRSGGFSLLTPGGTAYNEAGGSMQCPAFMDCYNIFLRFFLIVQAVLTQMEPPVRWLPLDPSNPDDIDKQKEAQSYAKLYDRYNDTLETLGEIVRMLGMSGRTVSWTYTDQDAEKFGYEEDGTPRTFQKTEILGTLETKVPMSCKKLNKTTGYICILKDSDVDYLRDKYDWISEKIKPSQACLGENDYERYARLGVLCGAKGQFQIGDSLSHIATEGHFFLRPFKYKTKKWQVPLESGEAQEGVETAADLAASLFPDGVRVCFVGDTYASAYAESMDDHLEIIWPNQGDSMFRQGFMGICSIDTVQDNLNDLLNWIREKVDTGAGTTYVDASEDDVDSMNNRRAAPNVVVPAKGLVRSPDQPLSNSFHQTPDPQIPDTLLKLVEMFRGDLPEFLVAALPSIQGAETPGNDTASGYAMAAANAKGQLNIIWNRVKRMWATIRYQSAMCAAQCEQQKGKITVAPIGKDESPFSVDFDALKKGSFACYPDEDAGFPETTAQKRSVLKDWTQLAGQSPMVATLLDNPDNIEQAKELNGFSDLTFIPAEARTKQMFEIVELLQGAPIPPDPDAEVKHAAANLGNPAPMPFVPPQPQPSVPVQDLDYHEFEFAKCQEWLSSKARRDEERKGNLPGIQNVILHAKGHQAMIQQAAMAQAALAAQPAAGGKGTPSPPADKKPTPGTQLPPQGA